MKLKKGLAVFLAAAMVISVAVPTGMNASASEPVVVEDAESQAQATSDAESEQKNEEEAESADPEETEQDAEASKEEKDAKDAAVEEAKEEPTAKDATVEEADPQKVEKQESVDKENEPAVMSLLPLEEVKAYLLVTDASVGIESVPLDYILENLCQMDGTPIKIAEDATYVWVGHSQTNYDAEAMQKYSIEMNPTLDLSELCPERSFSEGYILEMIVGSGNQLDPENVRYVVTVYNHGTIKNNLSYRIYSETEYGYRNELSEDSYYVNSIYNEDTQDYTTVVKFAASEDDSVSYYLAVDSSESDRPDIKTEIYTKAEFEKFQQNGTATDISDKLLNQNMWIKGEGYPIEFSQDNIFYIVYRENADNGKVYAWHRFQILPLSEDTYDGITVIVDIQQQIGADRVSIVDHSYNYCWSDSCAFLKSDSTPGDDYRQSAYIPTYSKDIYLKSDCLKDEDCYVTLDFKTKSGASALDQVEKIVYGNNVIGGEDVDGLENIKDSITSSTGLKVKTDWALYCTVFYKDGKKEVLKIDWSVIDDSWSKNANFWAYGAKQGDNEYTYSDIYDVEGHEDTYNEAYGYQTLFLNSSDVDLSQLKTLFSTNSDENGTTRVFAFGKEQFSGESVQDFSGGPVQYTASYNNGAPRNYWVTFVKKESGAKLFVNGPSEREVLLTNSFEYVHDILIANIGDAQLTGLKVELNATHVKLDDYWTVGGDKNDTLAAFTTTETDNSLRYGELSNLAKIRLLPDGIGKIDGTLTISADGQTPVVIKLTGYAASPYIVTEALDDGVKYVPYSYVITTNNHYGWNNVSFKLIEGRLPNGLTLSSTSGEIYGVPTETGEFPIKVQVDNSGEGLGSVTAEFTLTIRENTNAYVFKSSDEGYQILETLGIDANGDYDFVVRELKDQLFVSNGQFAEFQDLWLNGEKLTDGVDYTKVSGSTRITIKSQTFANKAKKDGTNTIAAEFRVGGDVTQELKRTAQNFRLEISDTNSGSHTNTSGNSSSGSGSSGGNGSSNASETKNYIKALKTRILDANGQAMGGVTVELHSTPRVTVTDAKGMASFDTVEFGKHTLIVKDSNGNVLAQRNFELVSGNAVAVNGDKITVKGGSTLSLTIKVVNKELQFVTAVATGDSASTGIWMILTLSALLGLGILVYRKKYFANR